MGLIGQLYQQGRWMGLIGAGFVKIHGSPGFGSKDVPNPNNDTAQNDAVVNTYLLEYPTLTI